MQSDEISISMLRIDSEIGAHEIISLEVMLEVNQHGILLLSCILRQPDRQKQERLIGKEIKLSYIKEEIPQPLFGGFITDAVIRNQGGITCADITAMSASLKFDREIKSRSFQNMTETYGEIFEKIAGKDRAVFAVGRSREKLTAPIIQYEETDWQFINRIAGGLHTIVIPEMTNLFPQIAAGIVGGREYNLEEEQDYSTAMNFSNWQKNGAGKGQADEYKEYRVNTGRNLQLGDCGYFKGQEWIVLEKRIKLDRGIIRQSYCLGKEKGRCRFIRNEKLCGLSLEGSAVSCEGEKIKIALDIDRGSRQTSSDLYAYDYVPITGNLMYSMPEKGARVSLYFPGTEGKEMVINCLPGNVQYENYKIKVMELPAGNQLHMAPGQLNLLTKNDFSSVKISDRTGIIFKSRSAIRIKAERTIFFKSKSLQLTSDNRIYLEDKTTGDFIEMTGKQMVYHASRSVLSAVRHKTLVKGNAMKNYAVIKDIETVALSVMGGIRAGGLDGMEAKVDGGVPALCNGTKSFMRNIASISWKRTV